jgi:hypothetical protein
MTKTDPVNDFLRQRDCAEHVIKDGLLGLIKNWESVVESVRRGYPLGLDDYLNDLDGRQLLEEALAMAPIEQKEKFLERVRRSDKLMQTLVKPAGKCLWGEEVAETEGWTAEKNWWYFTQPIHANPELLNEIEEASF